VVATANSGVTAVLAPRLPNPVCLRRCAPRALLFIRLTYLLKTAKMNLPIDHAKVIAQSQHWLEKAVLGLDLCPFARKPYAEGRVRFVVSEAKNMDALLDDLERELQFIHETDEASCETTLLIHPLMFGDFEAYNDFLDVADGVIVELGYESELQIASFHPQYQFADTQPDDIENYTNRSPYPTLHILRESSVEQAIEAFEDTEKIYQTNIETLKRLGHEGWAKLQIHNAKTE
jgi:uncharacterized protein